MRVPYSWLQDYLPDLHIPAHQLAEKLTLAGVEVEETENFNPGVQGVVIGKIERIDSHPQGDNLTVVQVKTGAKEYREVVCGAFNIQEGDLVPVALPGAKLPEIGEIKETTIKGVHSQGMLCSPQELGLALVQKEEGILKLEGSAELGEDLEQFLELNDPVLTLELTPNRSDCLGMLGVAQEIAAGLGSTFSFPPVAPPEEEVEVHDWAKVEVKDEELCSRYTARVIRNLKVAPAPLWLQLRLLKAGIRPINNVVDITNYVMWETGQPLHAFDYSLVKEGKIIVRRAEEGETLITIDGEERNLSPEHLVIADPQGPIGLAGVMGGESTEISNATSELLLEAAYFHPVNIRRTARGMNMVSEASLRFEKGVDPEGVIRGQNRAARLMAELVGASVLAGVIDFYPAPAQPKQVNLRNSRLGEVLGEDIPKDEARGILERLGFSVVKEGEDGWLVEVPHRRPDVNLEEDLIEEVARLYGYHRIPTCLPQGRLVDSRESRELRLLDRVRRGMAAAGFFECITYSFINPHKLDQLMLPEDHLLSNPIPLHNPITEDQGVMRTTLMPGLLDTVSYNQDLGAGYQLLFETGSVFMPHRLPLQEQPREITRLGLAGVGRVPEKSWCEPSRQIDFFFLKGALEKLWERLSLPTCSFEPESQPFLHPTRAASLVIEGEKIGFLGTLHPEVADKFQIKGEVIVGEIDLETVLQKAQLHKYFHSLPRYPASLRDLAVLVPRELTAGAVEECIWNAAGKVLENLVLFDVYEGDPVPSGYRSLAYSLVYRSPRRTLTDEEVAEAHNEVEKQLYQHLGVTLRK